MKMSAEIAKLTNNVVFVDEPTTKPDSKENTQPSITAIHKSIVYFSFDLKPGFQDFLRHNGSGQLLPIPLHLTEAAPVNPLHPNCHVAGVMTIPKPQSLPV